MPNVLKGSCKILLRGVRSNTRCPEFNLRGIEVRAQIRSLGDKAARDTSPVALLYTISVPPSVKFTFTNFDGNGILTLLPGPALPELLVLAGAGDI
jgi:hypothetical protein